MAITSNPQRLGSAIAVADSTQLALLSPDGLQLGTEVYNLDTDTYWTLVPSTEALGPTVVEVLGTVGARWLLTSTAGGFVTLEQLASTTVDSGGTLIGINANGGMFSEPDLQGVLQEDVVLKVPLAEDDGTGGSSLVGNEDAGGYFTGTTVDVVLQEIGATDDAQDTAIGLRTVAATLAATTLGAGASLVGVHDAGGDITATNVEGALVEIAGNVANNTDDISTNTTAIGINTSNIATNTANIATNTSNIALRQTIAAPSTFTLSLGQSLAATLADNVTATAPVARGITHTTSGTAAAGFGVLDFVDLESAGGTTRRAMTDVTTLTTATDAAEVSKRVIQLLVGGVLADALDIRPSFTLFKAGTTTVPGVAIGATNFGWTADIGNSALYPIINGAVVASIISGGISVSTASNGFLALSNTDDTTLRAATVGGSARKMHLDATQGVVVGGSGAIATNATVGFLWIPTCAGTPTGVPDTSTGKVAMVYDTTNNKFYIYNAGWKGGTVPGTFI